ncbi:hypothetical protein [Roseicitreum antarcticum]|uniref:APCDD1 domain-containing protein n=1 Tax=Roseicitreum antarcticum TaxID=564137 RepID=A0A1H3G3Z4_9RHOB|nr:hypothetical protein [Roseicitreum antarcticum]SDX97966.1 hypothetical protein SAMN04488238_1632 [Roseicitreum antarcticum]
MLRLNFAMAAMSSLFLSSASHADVAVWKENVGGWDIFVDRTVDDACFMIGLFESGTFIRLQVEMAAPGITFYIGNEEWQSIEHGKAYDMSVQFGSRTPWTGEAYGFLWDGLPSTGMFVSFANGRADRFLEEFRRMPGVRVRYQGSQIASISLRGSFQAVGELYDCVGEMLLARENAATDPFSERTPISNDPFR